MESVYRNQRETNVCTVRSIGTLWHASGFRPIWAERCLSSTKGRLRDDTFLPYNQTFHCNRQHAAIYEQINHHQ